MPRVPADPAAAGFSAAGRAYIRRELDRFFGPLPSVGEGSQLKTWRGGPRKGEPKLPPAAQSLLERELMRLGRSHPPPRLFFTTEGIRTLRAMMANTRVADPAEFTHARRELGIDLERYAAK